MFGGAIALPVVRAFLNRFEKLWTPEQYTAWEQDAMATAVRAVVDPKSDAPRLGGVLFASIQRRHIRIEHVIVEPDLRRRGIAKNMFYRMVMDPRMQQYRTISARCPDDCDEGIAWLKGCKFQAISVLPGGEGERDCYLFTWSFDNIKTLGGKLENLSTSDRLTSEHPDPVDYTGADGNYGLDFLD